MRHATAFGGQSVGGALAAAFSPWGERFRPSSESGKAPNPWRVTQRREMRGAARRGEAAGSEVGAAGVVARVAEIAEIAQVVAAVEVAELLALAAPGGEA